MKQYDLIKLEDKKYTKIIQADNTLTLFTDKSVSSHITLTEPNVVLSLYKVEIQELQVPTCIVLLDVLSTVHKIWCKELVLVVTNSKNILYRLILKYL